MPDLGPAHPFFFFHLQKEQLHTKGRPFRGMSEEEVFTEVANLFRGQEDLLSEFGQFLPEAKRSLFTGNGSCEMNSGQKNEEKSLEHNKKRSRPSLLRPVSAPAKVLVHVWVLPAHGRSGVEAQAAGEPEARA